jgi:hypothetical protein
MRRRQSDPPTPDLTLTIRGDDRRLVADALIEACREYETQGVAMKSRGRIARRLDPGGGYSQTCADRLRGYFDQVIP